MSNDNQQEKPNRESELHRLQQENEQLKLEIEELKKFESNGSELEKALEEAAKASRIKTDFLSMMSHEIRTPMNGVIGMTSLLLDTSLTTEQKNFIDTLKVSAEGLVSIINDILDFSKIESGKMALEEAPFELRKCIEEALDTFAPSAIDKSLDLLYLIQPDVPPFLVGDMSRLRQILSNLVNNAIKFTEEGEIFVSVERTAEHNGVQELTFSVRDSGIGIPKEKIGILFEAFTQADAFAMRRYGCTGLGLAIAKHMIGLMGGRIWVESTLGKGSTFYFTVNLRTSDT